MSTSSTTRATAAGSDLARWRDPRVPAPARAQDLLGRLSRSEKIGQVTALWVGADASGGPVAPYQAEMEQGLSWDGVIADGLGQLTRPFGTAPVEPAAGAASLAQAQREVMAANRFGIPAQVHEECLAGFAAWQATAYPVPLSWGASFDPSLVQEMAALIGADMRAVGVHQGLAPVLDVVRDYRWGRVEETIGEDPHLVAMIGAAYVRGLESTGVVATLKHFAGYSASRAARNLGPVSIGSRELADVLLPPFEAALRLGGARSVMNSYTELDGVPSAADEALLTGRLRDALGFTGTVVADYFAIKFLHTLHRVAARPEDAAALALAAGIDVELPSVDAYGAPLERALDEGLLDEDVLDRAVLRVLTQKAELGLLDQDYRPEISDDGFDLDGAANRDVALRLARESVVLVRNDNRFLPLSGGTDVALIGPLADAPLGMLGCYSFPVHVGTKHPDHEIGIDISTIRSGLAELGVSARYARGCDVTDPDSSGIAEAVRAAQQAQVCVVAVGDRAGMFGKGTSGEGCDAADLSLPGLQGDLLEAILATGTPVVLVVLSGRPYALGAYADRVAAIVQAYFPGQAGGTAIAEVLTGAICPSGRLPVGIPHGPGSQPSTYLAPPLGQATDVSNIDPGALYPFGHGLSYTEFTWSDIASADPQWQVDGDAQVALRVTNTGDRAGADVVQIYLEDHDAQVTRPTRRLLAFARVDLEAGESAQVSFSLPADLTSFTGLAGRRLVEPGAVSLHVARSVTDTAQSLALELTGLVRHVGTDRALAPTVSIERVPVL